MHYANKKIIFIYFSFIAALGSTWIGWIGLGNDWALEVILITSHSQAIGSSFNDYKEQRLLDPRRRGGIDHHDHQSTK